MYAFSDKCLMKELPTFAYLLCSFVVKSTLGCLLNSFVMFPILSIVFFTYIIHYDSSV